MTKTQPSVCIETYGCSFNASDGEVMAGLLEQAGYRLVERAEEADLLILNTCTVKDRTFWEFEKRLNYLKEAEARGEGPRLILAGCIPKVYHKTGLIEGLSALGPDTLDCVAEVAGETLAGRVAQILKPSASAHPEATRMRLPVRRQRPNVEILPIARGCMSACSFCQTRLARGRLRSFRPGDIVRHARQAIAEGVSEIWLTAQDTGAYGRDCHFKLPRLLEELCALEGDFKIRLGMSSPIWIWEDLDAYLDALMHPKMFRFLHVPVQSGSDRVLRDMKRANTVQQYVEMCDAFRTRFPEGTLMTDIIVGFPTEDEEAFCETLHMLERTRPACVNRSKFSPRPGTAAASHKALPSKVITERSLRLAEVVKRLAREHHARFVGRRERALVSEVRETGLTFAYNDAYRPVLIDEPLTPGRWIEVEYTDCADFHLKGKRVRG